MFQRFVVVVAIALAGCADLSKYSKESSDLLAMFNPKVDGLLSSGSALKDRAMKLPGDLPGASDLVSKITGNNASLEKLKGEVGGYSGKIEEAIKAGNADEVTKLLESQKAASTTGLDSAMKTMDGLKGEVTGLEGKAAAAAAEKAKMPEAPKAPPAPTNFSKALSTGFSLSGNLTGIESQLVGFIEDAGKAVDKTTWFDFDRLLFKTGSSDLDMDKSKEQLTNVAEILKAYPKVKLKVGGYTDNQGKADANKKLSTARAQSVQKAIVGMGIKADRLDPEGYGAEHPVCAANDTDECRAKNRRISVRVTAK
jgi:outer membrane protein OmpA-like peptidoglycan-associated protein